MRGQELVFIVLLPRRIPSTTHTHTHMHTHTHTRTRTRQKARQWLSLWRKEKGRKRPLLSKRLWREFLCRKAWEKAKERGRNKSASR